LARPENDGALVDPAPGIPLKPILDIAGTSAEEVTGGDWWYCRDVSR